MILSPGIEHGPHWWKATVLTTMPTLLPLGAVSLLTDCKNCLADRAQVLIGIVPRVGAVFSQQSAKSVYPLSIANCKENRLVNCNLLQFFTTCTCLT